MLFVLLWFFYRSQDNSFKRLCLFVGSVLTMAVLVTREVVTFNNFQALEAMQISQNAPHYSFWLNFEKPLVGLLICAFAFRVPASRFFRWAKLKTFGWNALACVLVVCSLAAWRGYVEWDPKFLSVFFFWSLRNLLFTCFGEEAMFRGLLQVELTKWFGARSGAASAALVISSFAFGLAHIGGGWTYVGLSAVAGLFYGYVFQKTKSLDLAIATHWLLNSVHFLLFTYPHLKG
jgi:membrane protease YdiL (CAAX protease family)